MAYVSSKTFSHKLFGWALQEATKAAGEAVASMPRDEGLADNKFIYLQIPRLRQSSLEDVVKECGWEVDKCYARRSGVTLWPFTLYKEYGKRDRQTKAMEAALQVLLRNGYDVFMGMRYGWRRQANAAANS